MTYYDIKYFIHVKIHLFGTAKSGYYPDPHWFAPWIRIRSETNADLQHCLSSPILIFTLNSVTGLMIVLNFLGYLLCLRCENPAALVPSLQ